MDKHFIYVWIAICILFILVLLRPKLSGYTDSGKSIFDLDEFSWFTPSSDVRDLFNSIVVPVLKQAAQKYNNGGGLTTQDKANLTTNMNNLATYITTESSAIPTNPIIPVIQGGLSGTPYCISTWNQITLLNGIGNNAIPDVSIVTSSNPIMINATQMCNYIINHFTKAVFISNNSQSVVYFSPSTTQTSIKNIVTGSNSAANPTMLSTLPGTLYFDPAFFTSI